LSDTHRIDIHACKINGAVNPTSFLCSDVKREELKFITKVSSLHNYLKGRKGKDKHQLKGEKNNKLITMQLKLKQ